MLAPCCKNMIERHCIPPLGEMGSPRPMIDVLNELEEIIRGKGIVIEITHRISKEALKNIVQTFPRKSI
jgi:hypothetical protein